MNIGIIGAGKVGIALGHVLQNKGLAVVTVASRREESLLRARNYIGGKCTYTTDITEVADTSVTDEAVEEVDEVVEATEDESDDVNTAAEGSASDEAETAEENQRADEKGQS